MASRKAGGSSIDDVQRVAPFGSSCGRFSRETERAARAAHIALTKEGEERFAIAFRALADERRALLQLVPEL